MKRLFLIPLSLFLFIGCVTSASQVAFKETSNFNVIDFGSYQLYIDKRFEPVGDLNSKSERESLGVNNVKVKQTRYVFADTTNGKTNIKSAIAIQVLEITTPQGYWRDEMSFNNYKGRHFEKGVTDLHGIRIAYLVKPLTRIAGDVLKMGSEKGFSISKDMKYGVDIQFGKTIGRTRIIKIEYVEGDSTDYDYYKAINALQRAKGFIKLES